MANKVRIRDGLTGRFITAKRARRLSPKRVIRERIEMTVRSGK